MNELFHIVGSLQPSPSHLPSSSCQFSHCCLSLGVSSGSSSNPAVKRSTPQRSLPSVPNSKSQQRILGLRCSRPRVADRSCGVVSRSTRLAVVRLLLLFQLMACDITQQERVATGTHTHGFCLHAACCSKSFLFRRMTIRGAVLGPIINVEH